MLGAHSGARAGVHRVEQARVPAGTFVMGDSHDEGYPGEGERPTRSVTLAAYDIDATTVTVPTSPPSSHRPDT